MSPQFLDVIIIIENYKKKKNKLKSTNCLDYSLACVRACVCVRAFAYLQNLKVVKYEYTYEAEDANIHAHTRATNLTNSKIYKLIIFLLLLF